MNLLEQRRRLIITSKKSILPKGYKRVEYLESTGTQYINTGVIGKGTTKVTLEFMLTQTQNDRGIIGSRLVSSQRYVPLHIYPQNKLSLGYGNNYQINKSFVIGEWYKFESLLSNGLQYVKINDELIYQSNISGDINNNLPMFLFNTNNGAGYNYRAFARVKNPIIEQDNKIVRIYISSLDNNNRPCAYDTVSKQTFYNQGTDEFLYGNII